MHKNFRINRFSAALVGGFFICSPPVFSQSSNEQLLTQAQINELQSNGNAANPMQLLLQQMLMKQMQMQGGAQQALSPQVANPPLPQISESELARQLDGFPAKPDGVEFKRMRDGFTADGVRYIDPEGTIVLYGFDVLSGDVSYVVQNSPSTFLIKYTRVNVGAQPVTLASATRAGSMWQVATVTGARVTGDRLIPTSKGFVVARENTGFRYTPGKGLLSFSAPEDFVIAQFQNGDVSGTNHLLLQRRKAQQSQGAQGDLEKIGSTLKTLGNILGVAKKNDYAMLNLENNRVELLNISSDGNEVAFHDRCRQVNYVMASCAKVDFFDSLYDQSGLPNFSHYFWRISWYKTPARPVLIVQEGGLQEISAVDLRDYSRKTLFSRTLGIAGFKVQQNKNGIVSVNARMGFSEEVFENVDTAFAIKTAAVGDPR